MARTWARTKDGTIVGALIRTSARGNARSARCNAGTPGRLNARTTAGRNVGQRARTHECSMDGRGEMDEEGTGRTHVRRVGLPMDRMSERRFDLQAERSVERLAARTMVDRSGCASARADDEVCRRQARLVEGRSAGRIVRLNARWHRRPMFGTIAHVRVDEDVGRIGGTENRRDGARAQVGRLGRSSGRRNDGAVE
jgi:hypothetical protein